METHKKNILFIVPTLIGGGAEKTVANLSRNLAKHYNIFIAVLKNTNETYPYSGEFIVLPHKKSKHMPAKIIYNIKTIINLKKIKKAKKIDYSISFLTQTDMLNVFSKNKGTQNIISIRNTDSILINSNLQKLITRISCHKCRHIVAISNQVKDDLVSNFKVSDSKITTIYNPTPNLNPRQDKHHLNNTKLLSGKICINVARLMEQKGQWHLIRSFSEVVKEYPEAKLIILGQGQLKEYLQKLINEYQLNNNVFLMGFVNNPYYYMQRASCFVFSSLYEGLGNALIEALSCGTPIISCDCVSGPREILAPKTDYRKKIRNKIDFAEYGILTPAFDGKKRGIKEKLAKEELLMAQAIIQFFNKEQYKHYSEMSKKRSKDFRAEVIANQWKKLLDSLA